MQHASRRWTLIVGSRPSTSCSSFSGRLRQLPRPRTTLKRLRSLNDHWIRNQSHLLRTLSVTSTAPITVNDRGAAITYSAVKNLHVTKARLGQFPDLNDVIFWPTVRHGVVTWIAEQYLS